MSETEFPQAVYDHASEVDCEDHLVVAANWAEQADRAAANGITDPTAISMSLMHSAIAHAKAASQSRS